MAYAVNITAYVIIRGYKSGCIPVPGSPFASPEDREHCYPTSQLSCKLSPQPLQAPLQLNITDQAQLIQSYSLARFRFELSGNLN